MMSELSFTAHIVYMCYSVGVLKQSLIVSLPGLCGVGPTGPGWVEPWS